MSVFILIIILLIENGIAIKIIHRRFIFHTYLLLLLLLLPLLLSFPHLRQLFKAPEILNSVIILVYSKYYHLFRELPLIFIHIVVLVLFSTLFINLIIIHILIVILILFLILILALILFPVPVLFLVPVLVLDLVLVVILVLIILILSIIQ